MVFVFSVYRGPHNPKTETKHARHKSVHDFHLCEVRTLAAFLQLNVISHKLRTKAVYVQALLLDTTELNAYH